MGLSTREAAKAVGITRATLQKWIAWGKVEAPRLEIVNGKASRIWDGAAIAKLLEVKDQIYRKGRGRKKQTKGGHRG